MKNWRSIPKAVLPSRALVVDPFPGVYPTRWKIVIRYRLANGTAHSLMYCGKPTREMASRVYSLIAHNIGGRLQVWEFDRAGTIAYADRRLPTLDVAVSDWAMPVFRFYYPWNYDRGVLIVPWATHIMHRLRLQYKGRILSTYVTTRPAEISTGALEDHKIWLESAGLQLTRSR